MIDVTIGQYLPGDSLIHKTDARVKIIVTLLLMVSVFLCRNYYTMGFALLLSIVIGVISKIKPKVMLKGFDFYGTQNYNSCGIRFDFNIYNYTYGFNRRNGIAYETAEVI